MDLEEGEGRLPSRADLRRVVSDRRVLLASAMGFSSFALFVLLNSWLPTYLTESLGFQAAVVGLVVAVFPAVGIVSRSTGGLISDRLFGARRRPVAVASFLIGGPAAALIGGTDALLIVVALLLVSGFAVQLGFGSFFTYAREVVESDVAGTAVAFLTAWAAFGAFVAPVAAGWIVGWTGSYLPAFALAGGLGLLGLVAALRAPESTVVRA